MDELIFYCKSMHSNENKITIENNNVYAYDFVKKMEKKYVI